MSLYFTLSTLLYFLMYVYVSRKPYNVKFLMLFFTYKTD